MELKTGVTGQPYAIEQRALPTGETASIVASAVRMTATGVHAFVGIANGTPLADDTFNVSRDPDRVRLVNSAWDQLNGPQKIALPKKDLKLWLDAFCRHLWETWIKRIAVEDMAGDLTVKPAEFILVPYVIRGGGTILFAPPGSGKSYLAMFLAATIDAGPEVREPLWEVKLRKRMLYVNLERSRDSMRGRLARVNQCLGLPATRSMKYINARGRSLADVADALVRDVNLHKIDGVVVDSISRSGLGSLKEDESANRFIDVVNGLGVCWLAVGHTTRDDATHLFGSQMFDAGADLMVKVTSHQSPGQDLGLSLEVVKGNDTGKFEPEYVGLAFDGADLKRVYRGQREDFPVLASMRKPSMEQAIHDHLSTVGASTAPQLALATGFNRSNISTFLKADPTLVRVATTKAGVFYGLKVKG